MSIIINVLTAFINIVYFNEVPWKSLSQAIKSKEAGFVAYMSAWVTWSSTAGEKHSFPGIFRRLPNSRSLFSLRRSHLGSPLSVSQYPSSWLQTWYSSFGPEPSDFKSSFKLREGHFPTAQGSEKLTSPTENHSTGMKQLYLGLPGYLEGHRKVPADGIFLSS